MASLSNEKKNEERWKFHHFTSFAIRLCLLSPRRRSVVEVYGRIQQTYSKMAENDNQRLNFLLKTMLSIENEAEAVTLISGIDGKRYEMHSLGRFYPTQIYMTYFPIDVLFLFTE